MIYYEFLQVSETVFDTINHEYDKAEQTKKKQKKMAKFGNDEKDSDVILHGYVKKLVSYGFMDLKMLSKLVKIFAFGLVLCVCARAKL